MEETGSINRRRWIFGAIWSMPFLMGTTFAVSFGRYIFGRPREENTKWADAGHAPDLPKSEPQRITFERLQVDGWESKKQTEEVWLVADGHGRITAFSPACTHLGCAYHWQASKRVFVCPCHGSSFDLQGKVLNGPAPRPLDRLAVRQLDGRLWLGPVQPLQSTGA